MLLSTFSHIKGIGPKKERYLWDHGVITWNKFQCSNDQLQFPSVNKKLLHTFLDTSMKAYQTGDISFFAKRMPPALYYRMALTFPEETLFLDIETTGLSIYYDIITLVGWSIGKSYKVLINGQNEDELRADLSKAKTIVTFNGTLFDLKFIKRVWPDTIIPNIHIDLRYLAKKVSLSGGQKAIEKLIGYKRNKKVENMLGESAPILWHKYRRGDKNALKKLIVYNHEDIEGMKRIFDFCVARIIEVELIPKEIRPSVKFYSFRSRIKWGPNGNDSNVIHLPDFKGTNKPLCNFERLNKTYKLKDVVILGVDLVSSEQRKSGCCLLRGNHAQTCCLMTDEEIVKFSVNSGATLVSIDSPLSIPKGRTSFYDDDPFRKHGIMRHCEKSLKRRGINVYPCLIPSMQKLTRRGMILAEKLRQRGIPVIESYPGAAQDIMMIPRKQAGLDYLSMGLREFGIRGEFSTNNVSHDELDAITSAAVGLFFMAGKFEALGNPLEEYLIIPDLNGDSRSWLSRTVLGLENGLPLPDQKTVSDLERQGYVSFNLDEQEDLLKDYTELSLRASNLAQEMKMNIDLLRKWRIKELMSRSCPSGKIVVSGIRSSGDRASLFEIFGPSFSMAKPDSVARLLNPDFSVN